MKHFFKITILFILIIFSQSFSNNNWPIKTKIELASNFMEDRPGRYHAGLDIRTLGKNLPFYAPENGYVFRLNISPWGYGKGFYFKSKNYIYVFGHCSNFIPKINNYIMKAQLKKMRYRVNLFPKKSQLKIKKGELMGYTGETGIGPPHLHFEIRDKNNNPINPLVNNLYTINDTVKPTLTNMFTVPLSDSTIINGNENVYRINTGDTISIKNKAGIAIVTFDRFITHNKLGTYKIILLKNSDTLYIETRKKFSYNDIKYTCYERNPFLPSYHGVKAANLFNTNKNKSSFEANKKSNGIINGDKLKGINKIKVICSDINKNSVTDSFYIKNSKKTDLKPLKNLNHIIQTEIYAKYPLLYSTLKKLLQSDLFITDSTIIIDTTKIKSKIISIKPTFLFNSIKIRSPRKVDAAIAYINKKYYLLRKGNKNSFYIPYYIASKKNKIFFIAHLNSKQSKIYKTDINLLPQYRDSEYIINITPKEYVKIKKNKNTSKKSFVQIHKNNINFQKNGYKTNTNFLPIIIKGRPVLGSMPSVVYYKTKNKKFNFYRLGSKRNRFVKTTLKDSIIFCYLGKNSTIGLLRDIKAPEIKILSPKNNQKYTKKPNLKFSIKEQESGIWSDKQIRTFINSKETINEYNVDRETSTVLYPDYIIKGKNIFTISIKDNSGNKNTKSIIFYYNPK